MISTRLFFCLPSSVWLLAIGFSSSLSLQVILLFMPRRRFLISCTVFLARRIEIVILRTGAARVSDYPDVPVGKFLQYLHYIVKILIRSLCKAVVIDRNNKRYMDFL